MSPLVLLLLMAAIPCLAKNICRGSPDLDIGIRIEADDSGNVIMQGVVYPNGSWYLSEKNTTRLCFCDLLLCFHKCCRHPHQSVDLSTNSCANTTDPSLPLFKPEFYNKSSVEQLVSIENYHTIGTGNISTEILIYNSAVSEFFLLSDGTLLLPEQCGEKPLRPETFCIDRVKGTKETVAIVQKDELPDECTQSVHQGTTYPLGMMAPLPLLAVTFPAFVFVPKIKDLHIRCLKCLVSSLLIGYLVFVVQIICRPFSNAFCVPSALIAYMGYLSAFFWLNIIFYDIWKIFRRTVPREFTPKEEHRRFIMFATYSWGCPLLLVILTSLLQICSQLPPSIIKPNIGMGGCWFFGKKEVAVYLFLPLTILLISNIFFLRYVIRKIILMRKESECLQNEQSSNVHDKRSIRLRRYLKLILLMIVGLSWTFGVFEVFV